MPIEVILFDADGVLQRPSEGRQRSWELLLGSTRNVKEFLADIFAAELQTPEGHSSFPEALSSVLNRWNATGTLSDALNAWTMIEVDAEIADTIRALRRMGMACHLATNQESHRARYMSEALGYSDLFDREFYSCQIGVSKPAGAYFSAILKKIRVEPNQVLFLDDHQVNVDSARKVGLYAAVFTLEDGLNELHRLLGEFGIHVG